MQFGVREICDVVFKAKGSGKLGNMSYVAGQPVLYIDSAKTSTMEGAATTVYAQGGHGNTRLVAWEGEKTLTFTVEDALLSELGFAILSGAGLMKYNKKGTDAPKAYVHQTSVAYQDTDGNVDLKEVLGSNVIAVGAPIFVMTMEHGSITGIVNYLTPATDKKSLELKADHAEEKPKMQRTVFVDFYIEKTEGVTEMTIDAENFAGYYYVEASTFFKRQSDGKNLPAELIFPNVKIQSNFTFAMASTGDPSTFTFTMDAMPGYTRFDRTKKVLCAMQVIDESEDSTDDAGVDSVGTTADGEIGYPVTAAADPDADPEA